MITTEPPGHNRDETVAIMERPVGGPAGAGGGGQDGAVPEPGTTRPDS
jgi:hypothetical protein